MLDNRSNPRTWIDYLPIHGLVISGLITVAASGLWVIPTARAWFWFIPNGLSWTVFWLVTAILISSAYYIVRMTVRTTNMDRFTLDRFRTLFAAILLYFSGALLLQMLHIAPPIETWTLTNFAIIRFFILYTSFVVVIIYLLQGNALQSTRTALVRGVSRTNIDTMLTIFQIVILFFVPAIILAKLHILPVNPDITAWFTESEAI